jgi:hypothetical protein
MHADDMKTTRPLLGKILPHVWLKNNQIDRPFFVLHFLPQIENSQRRPSFSTEKAA